LSHEARGDVDAVAEEIAIRLHHNAAQVYADAHFRFARFGEFERGFDCGKAGTNMKPSPAVLKTRPPWRAAMPSITFRNAATSAVVFASSASVRAE